MGDSDPFEAFRKQKESDLREDKKRQDIEAAEDRRRLHEIPTAHNRILELIRRLDPERIVLDLYDAGFRNSPRYPLVQVDRTISTTVLLPTGRQVYQHPYGSEQHETTTIAYHGRRSAIEHTPPLIAAVEQLTNQRACRQLERVWRTGHKLQIYVTRVLWMLVFGTTNESSDWVRPEPFGPWVALDGNTLWVCNQPVVPIDDTAALARMLAESTLPYTSDR